MEGVNEPQHILVDAAQLEIDVGTLAQINDAHGLYAQISATGANDAVAQYIGAWVDAHNNEV